jgi:type II secretory pathway pseudopilin PulG
MRTPFAPRRLRSSATGKRAGGFTLIEAAIATVIIGVGFTAMLALLGAGTVANKEGAELTTAINLANNIHEAAVRRAYRDLFGLEGTYELVDAATGTYQPVDAKLSPIPSMTGWSQVVDVSYVDPNRLTLETPDSQYKPTSRVTVTVRRNGNLVYRTSWLAAASD